MDRICSCRSIVFPLRVDPISGKTLLSREANMKTQKLFPLIKCQKNFEMHSYTLS